MTSPKMTRPRGYDTIKPLVTPAGEPLRAEPVTLEDCDGCCICCRHVCEGYRDSILDMPAHIERS